MSLRTIGRWIIIAGVAIAVLPLVSVALSFIVAGIAGCDLNEGNVRTCIVFGRDIGESLYTMMVAGWYTFFSLPIVFVALIAGGTLISIGSQRERD